jgi:hypothetical protein
MMSCVDIVILWLHMSARKAHFKVPDGAGNHHAEVIKKGYGGIKTM